MAWPSPNTVAGHVLICAATEPGDWTVREVIADTGTTGTAVYAAVRKLRAVGLLESSSTPHRPAGLVATEDGQAWLEHHFPARLTG